MLATSELKNSESPTGSRTCLYTNASPVVPCAVTTRPAPTIPAVHGVSSRLVRVALFVTCFNDTLFPQTGRAVVELLERLGCEVAFPEEQTCCGQMHFNSCLLYTSPSPRDRS